MWEGIGESDVTITYDVYLADYYSEQLYSKTELAASGITDTSFIVSNLQINKTYYWTVIPSNAQVIGFCDSGTWTFSFDPSAESYKLDFELPQTLEVTYGKGVQIPIHVNNIGVNPDFITPSLISELSNYFIAVEGTGLEHYLDLDASLLFILEISADKIPLGTYNITVSMHSLGSGETTDKTMILSIVEEKESGQNLFFYASGISLILVIILIIGIFFFLRYRRKRDESRRVDAELVRPEPKDRILTASEIQFYLDKRKEIDQILFDARKTIPRLPPGPDDIDDEKTSKQKKIQIVKKKKKVKATQSSDPKEGANIHDGNLLDDAFGKSLEGDPEKTYELKQTKEESSIPDESPRVWKSDRGKEILEGEEIIEQNDKVLFQIKELNELKKSGLLTEEEFNRKKRELLNLRDNAQKR
jgi:hypothetical protein